MSDPQSLNRYAYLSNRPLAAVDQYGLCGDDDDDDDDDCGGGDGGGSYGGDGGSDNGAGVASSDPGSSSDGSELSLGSGVTASQDASGNVTVDATLLYNSGLSAQSSSDSIADGVSTFLDGLGLIPEVGAFANGANAILQASRGNYGQASLYLGGAVLSAFAVPGGSAIAKGAKVIQAAAEAEVVADAAKVSIAAGRTGKIQAVIAETLTNEGNLTSGTTLTADELLNAGNEFLGNDAVELGKPGSGVFRNVEGTRRFRIDSRSLLGAHSPNVPRGHLEIIGPNNEVLTNNHIPFTE